MIKKHLIKGWITSIVGVATMVISLVLVFTGKIDFVWDGLAGLGIGTVLLMAPRTIEKQFMKIFSFMSSKSPAGTDSYGPQNDIEEDEIDELGRIKKKPKKNAD